MSGFKPYPAYKDSRVPWIGEIPVTWEVKPFKWLLDSNDGGVWGDDPTGEGDTLVLRSTDQTVDGNWRLTDPAPRKLSAKEKASALLVEGDLVVTKSSGSSLHIGKTTLVTADIAKQGCCYGNFMQRLRVNSSFTPKLAWYVMNNELARAQLDLLSNSTTGLANLNATLIGEILLSVSSVAEQTQIARFLDHETARIDALIEEQQRLIELLKEKRQAVISHAVTKGLDPTVPMKDSGVEWLGEVPAYWEVVPFGLAFEYQEGPGIMAVDFRDEGVPLVRISGVQGRWVTLEGCNYLEPSKVKEKWAHFRLDKGDLIISGSASMGLVSEVGEDAAGAVAYTGLIRLKPRTNISIRDFIRSVVGSYQFHAQIDLLKAGSTIQHFGPTHLSQMKVVLPPVNEQAQIAAYVDNISVQFEELLSEAEKTNALLQERRSALISAAVTGKIDVHGWQPPARAQAPELEEVEAV